MPSHSPPNLQIAPLPSIAQAERSLLGAMMLDEAVVDEVKGVGAGVGGGAVPEWPTSPRSPHAAGKAVCQVCQADVSRLKQYYQVRLKRLAGLPAC